jgi:hypothetical protein
MQNGVRPKFGNWVIPNELVMKLVIEISYFFSVSSVVNFDNTG